MENLEEVQAQAMEKLINFGGTDAPSLNDIECIEELYSISGTFDKKTLLERIQNITKAMDDDNYSISIKISK